MNFSKQTSLMAALFLSLGVGVPAIAAGAKAGGSGSNGSSFTAPGARGASGTSESHSAGERSAEDTHTKSEPTGSAKGKKGDSTFSVGEQRSEGKEDKAAHKRMGAMDKHQQGSLTSLDRETVMDLQTALQAEGVYQGSIDGMAGAQTKKALRQYQQARQLEASGRLDEETSRQLGITGPEGQVQPVRGLDDDMSPGSQGGFGTSPGTGTQGGTMDQGTGTIPGMDTNSGSGTDRSGSTDSVVNPVERQSGSSTSPGGAAAPVQPK